MTLIVHINGWPGSGKLAIGRHLATLLHARLLDNHTLINPAACLFDRTDPHYWTLRKVVRSAVFEYAARVPLTTPLILTDALAHEPKDHEIFEACIELAKQRRARLIAAVLDCDEQENMRRLISVGRAERLKLTDAAYLRTLRTTYELLRPTGVSRIDLDISTQSAMEVADALFERCKACRQTWMTQSNEAPLGTRTPEPLIGAGGGQRIGWLVVVGWFECAARCTRLGVYRKRLRPGWSAAAGTH
jgi:hypothetical protein